jgi:hypothetical protein
MVDLKLEQIWQDKYFAKIKDKREMSRLGWLCTDLARAALGRPSWAASGHAPRKAACGRMMRI